MTPLYDAYIFDCDGVLLDSNVMKNEAFRRAALSEGFDQETADALASWQAANFGRSRYVIFDLLMEGTFGVVPPLASLAALLRAYAVEVSAAYLAVDEADGARELLAALMGSRLYVVSGSDEAELRTVLAARGLASGFQAIYGSPATKVENLERVLGDLPDRDRVLFLGDAMADADAASAVGIPFLYVARYSLAADAMDERVERGEFAAVASLRDIAALFSPEAASR